MYTEDKSNIWWIDVKMYDFKIANELINDKITFTMA